MSVEESIYCQTSHHIVDWDLGDLQNEVTKTDVFPKMSWCSLPGIYFMEILIGKKYD